MPAVPSSRAPNPLGTALPGFSWRPYAPAARTCLLQLPDREVRPASPLSRTVHRVQRRAGARIRPLRAGGQCTGSRAGSPSRGHPLVHCRRSVNATRPQQRGLPPSTHPRERHLPPGRDLGSLWSAMARPSHSGQEQALLGPAAEFGFARPNVFEPGELLFVSCSYYLWSILLFVSGMAVGDGR